MKKNKKGVILAENIIFIVLNLIFLLILIFFLFSKVGGAAVLEEKYAKQIALMIDSAKPGMEIHLNVKDALEKADSEEFEGKIIEVVGNIVTVKLREKGGYSYSFFNDVDVSTYLDDINKGEYVITVN
ncbi:MAG: hypothetical protein Q8O84_05210 [Nanoarchaeota archaeon]|nr:hypothetical protein [Nanoarchaeota archaeon]